MTADASCSEKVGASDDGLSDFAFNMRQISEKYAPASHRSSNFLDLHHGPTEGLIAALPGAAIGEAFGYINSVTTREVVNFAPGGAHQRAHLAEAQALDREMLERGVRSRSVWLSSARNDARTKDHLIWLNEQGWEVRTAPTLPMRMIIADERIAILPLDISGARRGIIVTNAPSVVTSLQALFESVWATANPFGARATRYRHPLSDDERFILERWALGDEDSAIASQLGVSKRTISRLIGTLLAKLGARTRFEAGYIAVRSGWIAV